MCVNVRRENYITLETTNHHNHPQNFYYIHTTGIFLKHVLLHFSWFSGQHTHTHTHTHTKRHNKSIDTKWHTQNVGWRCRHDPAAIQ